MRNLAFKGDRPSVYLIAFVFSSATAFTIFLTHSPLIALAVSAGALAFTVFLIKPELGLYALLIASVCTAVSMEVSSLTIRPEQVITAILALVVFLFILSGKTSPITTSLDWLIIGYLFLNVLSSVVHAPDVRTSLQRCLLLAVTFSSYFVSTQLINSRTVLRRLVTLLIAISVVEAIYGIISVFLFTRGINIGGAHAPYGDIYARGTFLEGNIFGSFQMMISLILMSFLLSNSFRKWRPLLLLAFVLVSVSSVMSFTRAAWLGFLAGFICYLFFMRRLLIPRIVNYFPWIVAVLIMGLALGYTLSVTIKSGNVSLFDLYVRRFENIVSSGTYSASSRVLVWKQSIEFWKRNPILGNGTDSIKVLAVGTKMPMFGDSYWIPNSMILALHDTGILGLFCFSAIQLVFLWKVQRAMRITRHAYDQAVLGGFFAGFVGVQIAYFFTNAFWLIFIWLFMAIGMSCCRLIMTPPEQPPY